jgi:FMN phosphatase YigB (HAD superfamily)
MKQFKNISTLIFDFGGVLINLDRMRCVLNFKNLGVENIEYFIGDFAQKGIFMALEKGQITAEEFRAEVRKMSSNRMSDDEIDTAWCSFLVNVPVEKLAILLKLREKFRVILLSNTNAIHFPFAEKNFLGHAADEKSPYFDKYYLSYEMKMAKPDLEIFETLLASEQVHANNCLLLDDGLKNIEQAQLLGIQTYWVKENENLEFLLNPETWN